jgi:hypothetical protein
MPPREKKLIQPAYAPADVLRWPGPTGPGCVGIYTSGVVMTSYATLLRDHAARSRGHSVVLRSRRGTMRLNASGRRKVDAQWLFLHAGGPLATAGTVSEVNVRILTSMNGMNCARLPFPPQERAFCDESCRDMSGYE